MLRLELALVKHLKTTDPQQVVERDSFYELCYSELTPTIKRRASAKRDALI